MNHGKHGDSINLKDLQQTRKELGKKVSSPLTVLLLRLSHSQFHSHLCLTLTSASLSFVDCLFSFSHMKVSDEELIKLLAWTDKVNCVHAHGTCSQFACAVL